MTRRSSIWQRDLGSGYNTGMNTTLVSGVLPRVALFDVDGVLARGFTMLGFGRLLLQHGIIGRGDWARVYAVFSGLWKGDVSYARFASESKILFARALAGRRKEEVVSAAAGLNQGSIRLYWYAHTLVDLFRQRGIRTVAISGSPAECIGYLTQELGLDECHGSTFEVDGQGIYTGQVERNMAVLRSKDEVMKGLGARFDLAGSFAFGDTDQDLPMLERVKCPVAVNPKEGLAPIAAKRGWAVVSFRHDVPRRIASLVDWDR